MVYRKVVPQGLLNQNRVVVEGSPDECLPSGQVYVSPASGRVYNRDKGDKLANLPQDATEIPKTTWWLKAPQLWRGRGADKAPQTPFPVPKSVAEASQETHWYFTPIGIERLKTEYQEMKRYFPDFELYQDDLGMLLWMGKLEGLGEIRLHYPADYPISPFNVAVMDTTESKDVKLNEKISEYRTLGITPTGALIVVLRFFLKERGANVVSDNPRTEETPSRDRTDA